MIAYILAMATYGKREKHEPARQFLIRLPLEVDARLEEDARRCRRSKTRQVEAILVDFYGMESTDLQEPSGTRSRGNANVARAPSPMTAAPVALLDAGSPVT